MFEFMAGWLILSAAAWATAGLLPGVKVKGFGTALCVAAVFSILNMLFGGIVFFLIGVGTLGIGFLLFFITAWIANAIMLWITAALIKDFKLDSFKWALGASFLISTFSAVGSWIAF